MEAKTIHLTLMFNVLHNATELLFIVNWHDTVFIVTLLHTSTGPAVHTATDIMMPECTTLTVS
jgi:hypothetical protein